MTFRKSARKTTSRGNDAVPNIKAVNAATAIAVVRSRGAGRNGVTSRVSAMHCGYSQARASLGGSSMKLRTALGSRLVWPRPKLSTENARNRNACFLSRRRINSPAASPLVTIDANKAQVTELRTG